MERVLDVYMRPYDSSNPVLCFDEQPCFLIGDKLAPVPLEPGKVPKQDDEYKRFGSAVVLLAVEPRTGRRFVKVCERRTAKEYTEFLQQREQAYREAKRITIVQDNLNTHHGGSFYQWLDPEAAHRLVSRFEWVYTPKHASWLNMAELEFSALQRQCLNRRIPTVERLRQEVETWVGARNNARLKLNWQFSIRDARRSFGRHYKTIRNN